MTIEQVTQGVVNALYVGLSNTKIYIESVKQDLDTPCVLVKCLNPSQGRELGRRYLKSLQYAVQYFPNTDNINSECNAVCDSLFGALEEIEVDGRVIHGLNMSGSVTDEVLTFTVTYDVFIIKEEIAEDDMASLNVDVGVE